MSVTTESLSQYWPLGEDMPARPAPDEVLYYQPATPISDDEDDEAVHLPQRFDTIVAGTKRARPASFTEQRAAARKKVREDEVRRLVACVGAGEGFQDITSDSIGSQHHTENSNLVSGSRDDNDVRDHLQASPGPQDNVRHTIIPYVTFSINDDLGQSLRSFGSRTLIAARSAVTTIKNALTYRDCDLDQSPAYSEDDNATPGLPGRYISTPPTSPRTRRHMESTTPGMLTGRSRGSQAKTKRLKKVRFATPLNTFASPSPL